MEKQRGPGKPFQPGNHFGRGRPPGSRNKSSHRLRALLESEGDAIVRSAIELAKLGDATALKLCVERLLPACKERSIALQLPGNLTTAQGTLRALGAVVAALARGDITPGETLTVASVLDTCRQAVETQELERRLAALEKVSEADAPPGACTTRPPDPPACDLTAGVSDSTKPRRD
jgi:hypothetical protein